MKQPKRINSVSVGLAVVGLVVGYLAWAFLPVFWPLWRVAGMTRTACAEAYNSTDDEKILTNLVRASRRSGLRLTKENFRLERVPYSDEELAKLPEGRQEKAYEVGKTCIARFRYVSDYPLPLIGTRITIPYESAVEADLAPVDTSTNELYELMYGSCTCTSVGSSW